MILIANNDRAEGIVRNGRPGEAFLYYVGDLSADRKETGPATSIARRMMGLYERGIVELVRRRLEPGIFEYIAIRKRQHQPRY